MNQIMVAICQKCETKSTLAVVSSLHSQLEMAVRGFVEVSSEKAPDPVKQALWKDILNLRAEIIHLKLVNWCLAHSEYTVRQMQLESERLGGMVKGLLERAQVCSRSLHPHKQALLILHNNN